VPLIVSAVLPLVVVPDSGTWIGIVVGISTWLVFLADFVVHLRRVDRYVRTGFGRFDLVVVIATAPWFLLPGAQGASFVVVLRLARLARLIVASRAVAASSPSRSRRRGGRRCRVGGVVGGVPRRASDEPRVRPSATPSGGGSSRSRRWLRRHRPE
jgi:hypothetical protein